MNVMPLIQTSLPPAVISIASLFCKVHQVWKGYKRTQELTESASNFSLGLAGWIVDMLAGGSNLVRIPARTIFIARKVMDSIITQKALIAAWKEVEKSASEEIYLPKEWITNNEFTFLSPSTRHDFKNACNRLAQRVLEVAKASLLFISALFEFSMTLMSLLDAFSLKESITNESIQGMFINLDVLSGELKAHQKEIQAMLESVGAVYKIQTFTKPAAVAVRCFTSCCRPVDEYACRVPVRVSPFLPKSHIPKIPLSAYHLVRSL